MASPSEYDYICPVCREIFKDPVVLTCKHNFCKECLHKSWKTKETQECPVCRRRSSKDIPIPNFALKKLCNEEIERCSVGSEEICSLHGEKLQFFCLEDKQPACLVCKDSQQHDNHKFRPISEVIPSYKKEHSTKLKFAQEKLQQNKKIKMELEKTIQHIKTQAEHTERVIKHEFEKLHQFLGNEEKAAIAALRKEEEQKKQRMKDKLEEINRHISDLSNTIKDTEKMLKTSDVSFLKEFPVSVERVQISQPDPQWPSGSLIDVSNYLANLPFRVWKKMGDVAYQTPVILDPNTAHPELVVSDDLTSVRDSRKNQPVPDNPERFDWHRCVLASKGFNSGKHTWDVEVKGNRKWNLGVTTASNQRKGFNFFDTDVWSVEYGFSSLFQNELPVEQELERVRVELDYDSGTVTFSDPVTNTHLHTFTTTFSDTIFPFFNAHSSLRVLQLNG